MTFECDILDRSDCASNTAYVTRSLSDDAVCCNQQNQSNAIVKTDGGISNVQHERAGKSTVCSLAHWKPAEAQ